MRAVVAMLAAGGCTYAVNPLTNGTGSGPTTVPAATVPDATLSIAPLAGGLAPPASLAGESSYCWFLVNDEALELFVVGMDSGSIEPVDVFTGDSIHDVFALAYTGTSLVSVGHSGWSELDLASRTVRHVSNEDFRRGLGALEDGQLLLAPLEGPLEVYPDLAALEAGTPASTLPEPGGDFERIQIEGDLLYGAWHSTNSVEIVDLASGATVRSLELEDYDTWVSGLGVAGGMIHLLDDGRSGEHPTGDRWISRFDELSGDMVNEVDLGSLPHPVGLYCEAP